MLKRKLIVAASSLPLSKSLSLRSLQRTIFSSLSSSSSSSSKDDNYDSLKDETLCQYSGLPALNQYLDDASTPPPHPPAPITNTSTIDSDDNLQGHWKSMESRVKRKSRHKGEGPDGRGTVRVTGWDAENV